MPEEARQPTCMTTPVLSQTGRIPLRNLFVLPKSGAGQLTSLLWSQSNNPELFGRTPRRPLLRAAHWFILKEKPYLQITLAPLLTQVGRKRYNTYISTLLMKYPLQVLEAISREKLVL